MGERSSYGPGVPNWVDLSTSDAAGAKEFYGGLLGWDFSDQPVPDGSTYSQVLVGGRQIAGLYEGDGSRPTVWNMYLAVESADRAAREASSRGGSVVMEPFDVMDVGRMAFVQDPTGAFVAFWEARAHHGCEIVNGPGLFSWAQLVCTDVERAREFYGGLFGYEWEEMPSDGDQPHLIAKAGGHSAADVMGPPPGAPAMSYWLAYFGTDDLEAATARIAELGGSVMAGPMEVPETGDLVVAADPQGGVFALYAGLFDD